MPNDNSREIEAALHEDDEPEPKDDLSPEQRRVIEEEAMAEEEFIADQEDSVNPLFFNKENEAKKALDAEKRQGLEGAFGSEALDNTGLNALISNEEELRKENVDEDNLKGTLPTDESISTGDELPTMDDDLGAEGSINASMGVASSVDLSAENMPPSPFVDNEVSTDEPVEPITDTPDAPAPVETVASPILIEKDAPEPPAPAEAPVAPAPAETPEKVPAPAEAPVAPAPAETPEKVPAPAENATPAPAPTTPSTPTPIPAGMPGTSESTGTVLNEQAEDIKKKKKKKGLIAFVVVLVLVIGGGIAGYFWYQQHEDPKKQVSDAIENLLEAPLLGTVSKAVTVASGNTPSLDFTISSSYLKDNKITASVAIADDASNVYFKLGNLGSVKDAIWSILDGEGDPEANEIYGIVSNVADSIVKAVDNKWIVIARDNLSNSGQEIQECVSNASKKMTSAEYRKKLADIYRNNTFIQLDESAPIEDRDGLKYYTVTINEAAQKGFGKEVENTDEYKELMACSGTSSSDYDLSSFMESLGIEYDDEDKDNSSVIGAAYSASEPKTENIIKLGITSWSHELQAIEVKNSYEYGDEKNESVVNVKFGFIENSAYKDAMTAEELVETIKDAVINGLKEYAKIYAKEECESIMDDEYGMSEYYEFESVDECIDEFSKEFDEMIEKYYENVSGDELNLTTVDLTNALDGIKQLSLIDES